MDHSLELYNEHEKILKSLAWKYSNNNPSKADELRSVANHHYWKIYTKIESSPDSSRQAFIYRSIKNALLDFIRKNDTPMEQCFDLPTHIQPERSMCLREAIAELSEEGKYITSIFLEGKAEMIGIDFHNVEQAPPPRKIRGQLIRFLIDQGWSESTIYRTFNEVKMMVNAI